MTVKEEAKQAAVEENGPDALGPGFHVMRGKECLATGFLTKEDAQAHIDGHLEGKGEVVEGTDPEVND